MPPSAVTPRQPGSELRISIDATALAYSQRTGIGRVLESIVQELPTLAGPDTRVRFFSGRPIQGPVADLIAARETWDARSGRWPSLHAWQQLAMAPHLRRYAPSVHLAPDGLLPAGFRGPTVGIVHDLLWRRHPETCKAHIRALFEWRFPASLRQLSAVQFDSEFTRTEVSNAFPSVSLSKGRVVPLGVCLRTFFPPGAEDRDAIGGFMKQQGLAAPYFLVVGNLRKHKNLGVVFSALKHLKERSEATPALVIVGAGTLPPDEASRLQSLTGDQVRTLGYVDEDQLRIAYQGAQALIMPSKYEGFGLPVLEAMAAGVPVIHAKAGALGEVAGDAGLGFDPDDARELAEALNRISSDPGLREAMRTRSLSRVREFSWQRHARTLWDTMLSVAR